ncbi:NADP-dependent malic enzyme [Frankliniella fusca]|uniref:NADP-dependent malic enzyme n=1 Tax=Frankliniella fusca TaxID=407009 RepID=A0AAE1H8Z9_9NEOP|nr:NADP-dependent malic enzyme [Frankliniella fusca]
MERGGGGTQREEAYVIVAAVADICYEAGCDYQQLSDKVNTRLPEWWTPRLQFGWERGKSRSRGEKPEEGE